MTRARRLSPPSAGPRRGSGPWILLVPALAVGLPLVFDSSFALTLLSQMGIFIVFALSFNMLFGQGGMLSFGHAVYSGLGAFVAVHLLNAATAAGGPWATPLSVALLPLAGGLAGACFGIVFGYPTTRRAGTPFAMITLGIGEMVHAAALMFPGFFGGEGGISTDRVVGEPWFGISFGPAIQVYYLIAGWCLLATALMFAFSLTPLGRISNAVRDNPERAEFIGYSTRRVRFLVVVASSFFAGIAGGLSAINFELVTAENVSTLQSGGVLVATVIGGSAWFLGPVLGAIVFVLFAVALSGLTQAWLFYLGLFFVTMVMYAPGGLASLVALHLRLGRQGLLAALGAPYLATLAAGLALGGAVIVAVELAYQRALASSGPGRLAILGLELDPRSGLAWLAVVIGLVVTAWVFGRTRRAFAPRWQAVQTALEAAEAAEAG